MISLCMIVRNEAHCLGRCLDSVHSYVDEIIIVDTGSDDETVNIARRYGAKVFQLPWQHDFAAARNFSLEQASGEWILYLDADEELDLPAGDSLKTLTRRSDVEAYYFVINNLSDNGEVLRHINVRLFRNRPHYRFEGKLHEQILDAIMHATPQGVVINSGLNILHYGYLSTEWTAKNKTSRNYHILQQLLKEQPNNPFYLYHLGNTCINLNNLTAAVKNYQQALQYANLKHNYVPSLFLAHISCLFKLGRLKEGLYYIEQCQQHYPDYPDIHFLAGELYKYLGLINQSKACFEKCLHLGENRGHYTTKTGSASFMPLFQLAQLYQSLGQYDQAIHYQLLGIKTKGADRDQLVKLVKLLQDNDTPQIPTIIAELLDYTGEQEEAALELMAILVEAKEYYEALDILDQLPSEHAATRHWQGICYFCTGHYSQAIEKLTTLSLESPLYHDSRWYLIFSCWSLNPPLDATQFIKQLADTDNSVKLLLTINDMLLEDKSEKLAMDNPALSGLIEQVLSFDNPALAVKILQASGLKDTSEQITYLTRSPVKDKPLELAAKLVLTQLKAGDRHPDYYYLLAYYFYSNNDLVLAQQMITRALENHQATHYLKLRKDIYRQQLLKIVTSGANNYPDNKQFMEQLLELSSGKGNQ